LTEEPAASRPRRSWLSPGRLAAAGALILVLVFVATWIAPAGGYQLQLVDPAHPVAPLVRIAGHPTRNGGPIYFVDVRERPARLIERLVPWFRGSGSSLVKSPPISTALEQRLGQVEMSDSQKIAPYVALKLLGYNTTARSGGVTVLALEPKAPAAKVLKPGDVIVAVDGKTVRTVAELRAQLADKRPGDSVNVRYRRGTETRNAELHTVADPTDAKHALIGVTASDNLDVKLPVNVKIDAGDIGGPSAGLAFALDILQELGRNVTHGERIAATGELALDGSVLPIGGVKQKTLGVRRAGVDVFLVPAGDNAREARKYADGLRIIPVENVRQALRALATLGPKA
jgi:PDZ domain-containing protein